MKLHPSKLRNRLYFSAAAILIIGMGSSCLIYFSAADIDTEHSFGNPLDESKSYRRSLELYGGKANLLASQFMQWFDSLWQGKALGITLATITAFLGLALVLVAYNLPSDSE